MDKEKKYVFGVFLGAVALIVIMLITSIFDIIGMLKVNKEVDVNKENVIQSTENTENVENTNKVSSEE